MASTPSITAPILLQGGECPLIYGAELTKDGERLYVRMEQLTESNSPKWYQFCKWTTWLANDDNGLLNKLVIRAGKGCPIPYERVKDQTGFSEEEYLQFTEEAVAVSQKTEGVVGKVLSHTSVGSNHLFCQPKPNRFIVYVTNDRDFSIDAAHALTGSHSQSLKTYIAAYQKILIAVGCGFSSKQNYFHNRGIFRNPYWVFQEKYGGLSMLLHAMTGMYAKIFSPQHQWMEVMPVGSMLVVLKKNLQPGDGFVLNAIGAKAITEEDEKTGIDITEKEVDKEEPEGRLTCIKVSALVRMYYTF